MKHTSFTQTDVSAEPTVSVREIHTPVVIERTAKIYKLGMLVGSGMMLFGVLAIAYSLHVFFQTLERYPLSIGEFLGEQKSVYVSLGSIVFGFLVYRFEKFLAWWNNG